MIEWVPWLLILIGWHPDSPHEQHVVKVEVVVDYAECEDIGERYLEAHDASQPDGGPHHYRFFCDRLPDRESFDAAMERMGEQRGEAVEPQ